MTLWILLCGLALAQDAPAPTAPSPEEEERALPQPDATAVPQPRERRLPREEGRLPAEDAILEEGELDDEGFGAEIEYDGGQPVRRIPLPPAQDMPTPGGPGPDHRELPPSQLEHALEELEPVPPLIPPGAPSDQPFQPVVEPEPVAPVEITVFGPAAVRQARAVIIAEMAEMGYRPVQREGGRVVFRPPQSWMGRVTLEEDGQITFRRPVIAFRNALVHGRQGHEEVRTLPGIEPNPNIRRTPEGNVFFEGALDEGEGVTVPPIGGTVNVLPSMEKLQPIWDAVLRRITPHVEVYRQVRAKTFLMERLEMVSANLQATWRHGEPLEGSGPLPSMEDRRRAILEFWGTRLPNPEGLAVSQEVEGFLRNVVQRSDHPVTAEEAAWAEGLRQDDRPLRIAPGEVYELDERERPPQARDDF